MLDSLLSDQLEDLLIFGLDLQDISERFRIGNMEICPDLNVVEYLKGYDEDDVMFIAQNGAILAKCYESAKQVDMGIQLSTIDEAMIPFRLYKAGWMTARVVAPVVKTKYFESRGTIEVLDEQIWAEPMRYTLQLSELKELQAIYEQLSSLPLGYLDIALRRFSRSYEYYTHNEMLTYSGLDDCLTDLVIALESITSRGGDSIQQSMALRTALIMGDSLEERRRIEKQVKAFYGHRSTVVHGSKGAITKDKEHRERFELLEEFRTIVRKAINASIRILISPSVWKGRTTERPKTMAEAIDRYLFTNTPPV